MCDFKHISVLGHVKSASEMSDSVIFQSHLTSIMEILTKTAVAEIIKLVDESCAALRSEMSRSRSENEALRMKLKLMEGELSRRSKRPDSPQDQCVELHSTVRVLEGEEKEEMALCGRTWDMDVWGDAAGVDPALEGDVLQSSFPMDVVTYLGEDMQQTALLREKRLQDSCLTSNPAPGLAADGQDGLNSVQDFGDMGIYDHSSTVIPPPAGGSAVNQAAKGFAEQKPEADLLTLVVVKEEAEMQPVCSEEAAIEELHAKPGHSSGRSRHVKAESWGSQQHRPLDRQDREKLPEDTSAEKEPANSSNLSMKNRTQRNPVTGEKLYSCAQCGKQFSHQSNVYKHMRIHTGERPFRCASCGKCFTQQSNLRRHQLIHTGEKPFGCTQCSKSFTRLFYLKIHQQAHSR